MGYHGGGTGSLIFKGVRVPKSNVVGNRDHTPAVFNTMLIPERLGTTAMAIGATRPAREIATSYNSRRKAFGQVINPFDGVSFQVVEAVMLLILLERWRMQRHEP